MTADSTKTKIIDAAEDLFAQHGFDGTSVRAICNAAEVNVAAVHYHFRGKEGVAEAIFERRMIVLANERKAILDELDSGGKPPNIRSLLEALVLPLANLVQIEQGAGHAYLKAFARLLHDRPGLVWDMITKYNGENMERIFDGLYKALPDFSRHIIQQRITLAGETLIYCLANPINFTIDPDDKDDRPSLMEFVGNLLDFLAGGFAAESTDD